MSSLTKALAATVFLWIAWNAGYAWWAVILYAVALLGAYVTQLPERRRVAASFVTTALLGFIGMRIVSGIPVVQGHPWLFVLGYVFFFLEMAALFGLMNLAFDRHTLVYGISNTALLFFTFLVFFGLRGLLDPMAAPARDILFFPLFAVVGLLLYEAFRFFGVSWDKRTRAFSCALAVLAVEFAALVSFLPLGFVNAAVFLALAVLLARDSITAHFQGEISASFLLRELTVFIVLTVLIFAVSTWSV